jgi:hypothetical protein
MGDLDGAQHADGRDLAGFDDGGIPGGQRGDGVHQPVEIRIVPGCDKSGHAVRLEIDAGVLDQGEQGTAFLRAEETRGARGVIIDHNVQHDQFEQRTRLVFAGLLADDVDQRVTAAPQFLRPQA